MTALVTGATGFVGSHAAARLAAHGHEVRVLVRDPAKLARVPALRDVTITDIVVGDVTDRANIVYIVTVSALSGALLLSLTGRILHTRARWRSWRDARSAT